MTWSDIIYRAGVTLTVVCGGYALWCFLYVLSGGSIPPWELVPPGVNKEDLVSSRVAQIAWAGAEATFIAAFLYAVTRSALYLLAWFKGDISN